ncbi:MAG: GGDEF domain-containing protein [Phycisphaeraceae bacterium]
MMNDSEDGARLEQPPTIVQPRVAAPDSFEQTAGQITWLLSGLMKAPAAGLTLFDFNRTWLRQGERFEVIDHIPEVDPTGTTRWHRFMQPMRGPEGHSIGMLFFLDDARRELTHQDHRSLVEMTCVAQQQMHAAIMQAVQSDLIVQIRSEQKQALIDPLTGIWNRTGVRRHIEQDWPRLTKTGGTAVIAMADIDRFKRINDRWGHQAGDEVLKRVAGALRDTMSPNGAIGRYGGEEFMMMLAADDPAQPPQATLERLRQNIALLPARYRGEEIRATISIGAVSVEVRSNTSIDDLVRLADESLYCAKAQGRNRVVLQQCA